MYPAPFEYARAESLSQALDLLAQHGEEARPLAGGMSLLPLMKLRLAQLRWLIDIGGVPDLDYIRVENSVLRFGALTRHVQVEETPLVRQRLPLVHDAVGVIGDVQVRNLGTVAGALAHVSP
jgi:carbon-monoxide dehydrogenase medium subunit